MVGQIDRVSWVVAAFAAICPGLAWGTIPTTTYESQQRLPADNQWQPAIELPQGDPLTDPLGFSPAEQRLFADAEDGQLDEHSLIEAALIAGGMNNSDRLIHYHHCFSTLCEELHCCISPQMSVIERIETIHRLLHKQVLQSYDADATQLAAVFDTGIYNCASGTILFIALAEKVGLTAQAIELPGHVRALVSDGATQWEVEITSPQWNEAIRRFSDIANENESPRSEDAKKITDASGLIAMIYYNQGIDAFHRQQFAESIAFNRRALLLDSTNQTARGNLLASVNNWALALCNSGKLKAADRLLTNGQKYDGNHQAFMHNAAYVQRLQMKNRAQ